MLFLEFQKGLLAKEDEQLPFARHVVRTLQHFHLVEDFVLIVLVWAQEVIVGDPEGKVIVGAVDVIKAVRVAVGSLIGAVEPFDHLFKRAVFRGDGIVIGKPDDLGDLEGKGFSKLLREFHCGEGIGAVAVGNELKFFRQPCKAPECHAHGKDARTNAAVVRDLVTDDGTGNGIHDKPDVGLDAADIDISFVSDEHLAPFVRILEKTVDFSPGEPVCQRSVFRYFVVGVLLKYYHLKMALI